MADAARWRIGLVNGPNMKNLEKRDRAIYGFGSIKELEDYVSEVAAAHGMALSAFHSNHVGAIVDWLYAEGSGLDGIVINPAGATRFGESIALAITDIDVPCVEVHFVNIARTHHDSIFSASVHAVVHGFSRYSYDAALTGLRGLLSDGPKP